jgi:chaperonin GroEL (HSP60 family)
MLNQKEFNEDIRPFINLFPAGEERTYLLNLINQQIEIDKQILMNEGILNEKHEKLLKFNEEQDINVDEEVCPFEDEL